MIIINISSDGIFFYFAQNVDFTMFFYAPVLAEGALSFTLFFLFVRSINPNFEFKPETGAILGPY